LVPITNLKETHPVARKTTVQFVDDLDDDQAADETITFALDGVTYQIDLSANHAATLREDLTTWTAGMRPRSEIWWLATVVDAFNAAH